MSTTPSNVSPDVPVDAPEVTEAVFVAYTEPAPEPETEAVFAAYTDAPMGHAADDE